MPAPKDPVLLNVCHSRFALPHDPGRHLHAVSAGQPSGPVLLCLHGATGNWSNYRQVMARFAHHYRLEAVDMPGHGRSPWPRDPTLEDLYQDMQSYVATLPKPIVVLAHSFGGYFGVRLAAEHPDWFSHMVLLNTAHTIPRGLAFHFLRWFSPWSGLLARPEGIISSGGLVTRHLVDHVLPHWECNPYYPSIRCPVLGIAGRLDPLIPHRLARSSLHSLGKHQFRSLPLGMHVAMWERPALLHRWISRFVEETR